MPHSEQVPELQRVDFSDVRGIIEAIKRDGGVIAKNFATTEQVAQVNADVKPHLDADGAWKVSRTSRSVWHLKLNRLPGPSLSTGDSKMQPLNRTQ